uniref:DDE Tnp4 domain-containing protein n=1 Tax=Mola mola TaxID=94237 RepID=A0A3Q3X6V8_MOLML
PRIHHPTECNAENLSKATVCHTVSTVYLALKSVAHIFITFPGLRRVCLIKEDFYWIAGFFSVIGAVDCTHIHIKRPRQNEGDFYNHDLIGYMLVFQIICNANYIASNIEPSWPGSVHDARIIQAFDLACILLGDSGYACEPFLLTPFTDPTPAKEAYDNAHSSTRSQIEETFGPLKEPFQFASAVLHNVACMRKERVPRVYDHNGRLVREQYHSVPDGSPGT